MSEHIRKVISILPKVIKDPLKIGRAIARNMKYYGTGRLCPVCGKSSRRFRKFGLVPRKDAQCVHCGSLERMRFVWLYITRKTDLFDSRHKMMLHVAPERCFESRFIEYLGDNYLTADLFNPRAMTKMDITDIKYPDQSFDVIYCSHVLEHVQDDKKAMREFYRVLKLNGWAILLVPITAEETFEDPLIVEPEERLKSFGQRDHVRRYGPDFIDRLREAGFKVEVTQVNGLVRDDEAIKMGLTLASGEIFYCTK
ncbi:MAG: methyltransferase domain-containing protein [Candidatus Electryonea clarkiae]|nr:methyltransferase domain-containing protein [Candidatus Electryonea clarkiae]MDP8287891.1 methyltransferase domain-containing protein [Candidatus Electryonea clarkiae]